MPKLYGFITGVKAAGAELALPYTAQRVHKIVRAEKVNTGNYPAAAAVAPATLTVVTGVPAAGQIQLFSPTSVKCGDALDAYDSLRLFLELEGEGLVP